jgi:DNA-binding transcriptional LysR family regulator
MELRRLRYFLAVAEQLSFRRAADVLRTSQPSLSQQIRALEIELGVELFERTKRRVRLTNAGAEFLIGVRAVIADVDAIAQRAREAHAGHRGKLSIGTNGMVMIDHLPRVVRAFRASRPEVELDLTILRGPDLLDGLRGGRIDLAITTDGSPDEELALQKLWPLPQHVVLSSHHPLAGKNAIALRELGDEMLITHPRRGGSGGNNTVLALCREQRFTPKAIKEVPAVADLETLIGLVACGFGFTILPAPFAHIAPPSVIFRPIAGPARPLQVSARWRINGTNALIEAFVQAATETTIQGDGQPNS